MGIFATRLDPGVSAPDASFAGSSMADYVIVFSKKGSHMGSTPWSGELDDAKKVARDGLIRRGADAFQIRSNTLDGPLVWEEQR
jgi:hypothetical protein